MNRLLFFGSQLEAEGLARTRPDQQEHLRQVLKAQAGQRLRAGVIHVSRGQARVGPDGRLDLLEYTAEEPAEEAGGLRLLLALPRPQSLRKILPALPQLGVEELQLCGSSRVERSFFHSPLLSQGEWRRHLIAGMEQAGCVRMPRLGIEPRFREQMRLLEGQASPPRRLLLHPGGPPPEALGGSFELPLQAAIGPEGGWLPREVEHFRAAGFELCGLGERILRVETAVPVALAQLALLARRKKSQSGEEHGLVY